MDGLAGELGLVSSKHRARSRPGRAAQRANRALLARAFRLRIRPVDGHHQSDLRRHRGEPVSLGGGARDLPADVRAGIRKRPVLSADAVRHRRRNRRSDGVHAASRVNWPFVAAATRALSGG